MKPTLLLLHGALGSAKTMEKLAEAAQPYFEPLLCEFHGHGRTPVRSPLSMTALAEEVRDFVIQAEADSVYIFGYSMGGYAALLTASEALKVNGIITYGTRMDWNEQYAEAEAARLDPEAMHEKIPAFTDGLADMHTARPWQELVHETAGMLRELGKENYLQQPERLSNIVVPVLFLQGVKDKTLQPEEYVKALDFIPGSERRFLPDQPHPLDRVEEDVLVREMRMWLLPQPE